MFNPEKNQLIKIKGQEKKENKGSRDEFLSSLNDNLSIMEKSGVISPEQAEEKRKAAALIENGFSDDPKYDALLFSKVGIAGEEEIIDIFNKRNYKKENTAENQEEGLNKDDYNPVGEIAEGYVLNQINKSEDFRREKKEEEIKKAYEAAKEYWDEKDKEKSAEQKSEEGPKEKPKQDLLVKKNKEPEEELKSRIEKARTAGGGRSDELVYEATRNFYLEKLGYSVKYVGFLHGKGRLLNEKGGYVLDKETGKPVEFKATFRHKKETDILKFLKKELENKNNGGSEKKSDDKEGLAESDVAGEKKKNSPEEAIKPEAGKEKAGGIKSTGAENKSKEKKTENKESEKVFNIGKLYSDYVEGKGFFDKENLGKMTIEKNTKEIVEAIKSYGMELKWPDDFESIIKKYDKEKPESSKFDKLKELDKSKEKKDKFGFVSWFFDLLFRMNVTIIKF